jgi:hypothetical protein
VNAARSGWRRCCRPSLTGMLMDGSADQIRRIGYVSRVLCSAPHERMPFRGRLQVVVANYAFVLETIHVSQATLGTARPAMVRGCVTDHAAHCTGGNGNLHAMVAPRCRVAQGMGGEHVRLQSTQADEAAPDFSAAQVWAAVQSEVKDVVFAYLVIPEPEDPACVSLCRSPQGTCPSRHIYVFGHTTSCIRCIQPRVCAASPATEKSAQVDGHGGAPGCLELLHPYARPAREEPKAHNAHLHIRGLRVRALGRQSPGECGMAWDGMGCT